MAWSIMLGCGMLTIHIVAKHDPHRQTVQVVALAAGWIILSNLFAFTFFVVDRFRALTGACKMRNSVAVALMAIGGFAGGWIGVCATLYKPPHDSKFASFFCKALVATAIGIAIDVFFILRFMLPFQDVILKTIT